MYRATTRLILVSLVASALIACQPHRLQQQSFLQFGTLIEVTLVTNRTDRADDAFAAIERLLQKRHQDWHGWQDGDLSDFNRNLATATDAGVTIPASLRTLIDASKRYYRLSQGRFNPALGKLIAAWGFHESSTLDQALVEQIQQDMPGMDDLSVRDQRATSLNPHLQLDFGGIAKGLALVEIRDLLLRFEIENFIANAGGDVFAAGRKPHANWTVAIEDPFAAGAIAAIDLAADSAVFTSGDYRRFFAAGDQPRRHHIIDPITGAPARHASSATVVHHDPVLADAAATALMLTPVAAIRPMAEQLGISQFLVITQDRRAFCSVELEQQLQWLQGHGLKIIVI